LFVLLIVMDIMEERYFDAVVNDVGLFCFVDGLGRVLF